MGKKTIHYQLFDILSKIIHAGILCILLSTCQQTKENNQVQSKPNFLILISDDQRWDQVSYPGNQIIPELETPNLDKLAAEGVFFSNAFATTPICAVSRASIYTGRYVSSHGMNHFRTSLDEEVMDNTYFALLKKAGYKTGMLGKWGIGLDGTEENFDYFDAWATQGNYFHDTDTGKIHNSAWLAAKAREFMKSESDQPFALTVCYKSPHHPYLPDPRDTSLFENVFIPARKSDTEEAYASLAHHVMDGSLNRWCFFDERKDEATREDFEKNFLRCVISLDRSVGQIMESLKDFSLDENTIVIFLSDHGYLWGEHGLGGKWLHYEESIRIPMIIRWPEMPTGSKGELLPQMVLNIDVAPTILQMAGIEVPQVMNGKSILPLLNDPESDFRDEFFLEHDSIIIVDNPIPDSYGIRTRDWKYIRYVNTTPEVEEMYELSNDPLELNNLIDDQNFTVKRNLLRERYNDYFEKFSKENNSL